MTTTAAAELESAGTVTAKPDQQNGNTTMTTEKIRNSAETATVEDGCTPDSAIAPEQADPAERLKRIARRSAEKGDCESAAAVYLGALAVEEKNVGPVQYRVYKILYGLASACEVHGEPGEAEPVLKRAVAILEKEYNQHDFDFDEAFISVTQGRLLQQQGQHARAELVLKESLALMEQFPDEGRALVAVGLCSLGRLYMDQGEHAKADPLCRRALAINEEAHGQAHPSVAESLENLAKVCRATDRPDEAKQLEKRAARIRAQRAA